MNIIGLFFKVSSNFENPWITFRGKQGITSIRLWKKRVAFCQLCKSSRKTQKRGVLGIDKRGLWFGRVITYKPLNCIMVGKVNYFNFFSASAVIFTLSISFYHYIRSKYYIWLSISITFRVANTFSSDTFGECSATNNSRKKIALV